MLQCIFVQLTLINLPWKLKRLMLGNSLLITQYTDYDIHAVPHHLGLSTCAVVILRTERLKLYDIFDNGLHNLLEQWPFWNEGF
jgi:hypothetical protein